MYDINIGTEEEEEKKREEQKQEPLLHINIIIIDKRKQRWNCPHPKICKYPSEPPVTRVPLQLSMSIVMNDSLK